MNVRYNTVRTIKNCPCLSVQYCPLITILSIPYNSFRTLKYCSYGIILSVRRNIFRTEKYCPFGSLLCARYNTIHLVHFFPCRTILPYGKILYCSNSLVQYFRGQYYIKLDRTLQYYWDIFLLNFTRENFCSIICLKLMNWDWINYFG